MPIQFEGKLSCFKGRMKEEMRADQELLKEEMLAKI
jgi:hypothetical protein